MDGAFLLHKHARIEGTAVLDVIGRDQPEQQVYLCRDGETLAWNFEDKMVEEWIEPADPVLESVNEMLTDEEPAWKGSASELLRRLVLDIQPNTLTKTLNVREISSGRLCCI